MKGLYASGVMAVLLAAAALVSACGGTTSPSTPAPSAPSPAVTTSASTPTPMSALASSSPVAGRPPVGTTQKFSYGGANWLLAVRSVTRVPASRNNWDDLTVILVLVKSSGSYPRAAPPSLRVETKDDQGIDRINIAELKPSHLTPFLGYDVTGLSWTFQTSIQFPQPSRLGGLTVNVGEVDQGDWRDVGGPRLIWDGDTSVQFTERLPEPSFGASYRETSFGQTIAIGDRLSARVTKTWQPLVNSDPARKALYPSVIITIKNENYVPRYFEFGPVMAISPGFLLSTGLTPISAYLASSYWDVDGLAEKSFVLAPNTDLGPGWENARIFWPKVGVWLNLGSDVTAPTPVPTPTVFPAVSREVAPFALAAGQDGSVLILERSRSRILNLSRDGRLLRAITVDVPDPIDVAVGADGSIFVLYKLRDSPYSDSQPLSVAKFLPNGTRDANWTIGTDGVATASISYSTNWGMGRIAVDKLDRVYVASVAPGASPASGLIAMFDRSGRFVRNFELPPEERGHHTEFFALAIDKSNRVMVSFKRYTGFQGSGPEQTGTTIFDVDRGYQGTINVFAKFLVFDPQDSLWGLDVVLSRTLAEKWQLRKWTSGGVSLALPSSLAGVEFEKSAFAIASDGTIYLAHNSSVLILVSS